jgi:hypothetical protein
MAALWTEVCLAYPALSAIDDGYEVYAVAGAIPMTWQQVMYEWQRDWVRVKTADKEGPDHPHRGFEIVIDILGR